MGLDKVEYFTSQQHVIPAGALVNTTLEGHVQVISLQEAISGLTNSLQKGCRQKIVACGMRVRFVSLPLNWTLGVQCSAFFIDQFAEVNDWGHNYRPTVLGTIPKPVHGGNPYSTCFPDFLYSNSRGMPLMHVPVRFTDLTGAALPVPTSDLLFIVDFDFIFS